MRRAARLTGRGMEARRTLQELERFRRDDDERRKRTAAGSLAIPAVTVKHQNRFCRGFVADRAARASAGEGCGKGSHNLCVLSEGSTTCEHVESLAGFQEGFHAGEHARPTPGNAFQHL